MFETIRGFEKSLLTQEHSWVQKKFVQFEQKFANSKMFASSNKVCEFEKSSWTQKRSQVQNRFVGFEKS